MLKFCELFFILRFIQNLSIFRHYNLQRNFFFGFFAICHSIGPRCCCYFSLFVPIQLLCTFSNFPMDRTAFVCFACFLFDTRQYLFFSFRSLCFRQLVIRLASSLYRGESMDKRGAEKRQREKQRERLEKNIRKLPFYFETISSHTHTLQCVGARIYIPIFDTWIIITFQHLENPTKQEMRMTYDKRTKESTTASKQFVCKEC